MKSFVEVLRTRAHEVPERVAYTFLVDGEAEEVTLTYDELDQQARAIAVRLETQRLQGQRVLLLYPPGLEYISAFWGCLYAGVVAVPAYPPRMNRNLERLQAIVADSEAAGILTTASTLARMEPLLAETPGIEKVCRVTTDDAPLDLAGGWRLPEINRESLAFLQYTSGSTAIPKGVMVTHGNLLHNESLIQRAFRQTQDSIIAGWLPLYHDMGLIGTVLQPVFAGARCVLMSHVAFLQRPMRWLEAISRYRVTTSGAPNFAYDLCTRKATDEERETLDLSSWTTAFNGAEPVRAQTLENFAAAFKSCGFRPTAFFPCYGLAEATLFVSGGFKSDSPVGKSFAAKALEQNSVVEAEVDDDETRTLVACGSSSDEQQILIIDPETHVPSAPGTVGEIWIAGDSITGGYWKRPEETKLTFGARVAGNEDTSFLRTGDLGFLHKGELFVTGRLKDLIIIRGRNLYPQDIEKTAQESHAQLRPGGCAAFSVDVNGEERLILVQEAERGASLGEEVFNAIRQAVAEEHEVQPYAISIVKAGSVPKTSSGKVQRRASRKMFLSNSFETLVEWRESGTVRSGVPTIVQPRSVEEIAQWFRLQLANRIGVKASKIDLQKPITYYGIDSLSTIELMHSVETSLGVVIPFTDFYRSPSIGEIADEAARQLALPQKSETPLKTVSTAGGTDPVQQRIPTFEAKPPSLHPLSPGQQAMWFLYRLEPENAAYNVPVTVRLRNEIDVTALRSAFQILVDRHAALRTTFRLHDGAVVQQVHEHFGVSFEEEDASGWDKATLEQRLSARAWQLFKLEEGPLFRVYLMKRAADDFLMQVVAHHIVSDLWSLTMLLGELDQVYAVLKDGATRDTAAAVLPRLETNYTDYVREQARVLEGDEGGRLWSFWQQNLAGQLPALNLLTDRPRAAKNRNRGKIHAFNLDAELTRKLDQLSRRSGTTLYMTLLAAYAVLLSRYSGQSEIVIGSPTAGRTRAAYTKVAGYFVNMLPFRLNLEGNPRFVELLERTRTITLDAFSHQEYPFQLIVQRLQPDRDASRTPLFQTTFAMQQSPFALGAGGVQLKLGELTVESFPLAERITQFELTLAVATDGAGLRALLEYNTELFDSTTIESMAQHLKALLTSITTDPEQRIASLPLLTKAEEQKLLVEWNETKRAYPVANSMLSLFEAQAQQTPDAIALSCDTERISYRELDERSNRLAHHLRDRCVGVEQVVGVLMPRTPELVVSLLAILKTGAAYVPLDPAYPAPRLQLMLEDAGARLLITTEALARPIQNVAIPLLCLDVERTAIGGRPAHALADVKLDAENLAYLIYTSGSTGRPKPVGVTHRSVLTCLHWAREVYSAEELSVTTAAASVCFDMSVFELFVPLSWGGEVILVSNALELATMAGRERLRMFITVPSAMAELARLGTVPKGVLTLNLGGEAVSRTLVQDIYEQTGVKRVLNLYGPSEDTMWSTSAELARDATPTIGRPIANTQAYVLDRELQPVPVGVAGELCLSGEGLARGYLGRPEQTADKFVPNPFGRERGNRMYRTGDLCRWLANGEIEFLGRIDNQVKLRGFRIELGEIEAVLGRHESVRSCVATQHDDSRGQRLVAYVVANEEKTIETAELCRYLGERLPAYMIPALFVRLEALPVLSSGKVDRKALPEPEETGAFEREYVAPGTAVEEVVARVWAEVLKVERVGVNDNFFDLGGHSLLLNAMQSKLSAALKREIPLVELFNHPTVKSLARYFSNGEQQEITERFSRASRTEETKQEPIAIIGMAGRFPGAKSVDELWQNLCAGVESVSVFSEEELKAAGVSPSVFNHPNYVKAKPVLTDMDLFDASFFGFNPREAEIMDPQHRVFLECASGVLENAGYDPDRYHGKIGVYAGASLSTYLFKALTSLNGVESLAALQQFGIGNGLWSLATRASYKLNLTGPSVSIQTACSTSLAAVHMACQSLLGRECDMALAGGASITVANNEGYLYQEGGIFSPDGHCRAFDAKAHGTLVGDGVALVVLKRLSEAIADGDTIHGVVLGSAMNNDGSVKIGFTAPSVEGQSDVIRTAHAKAGITADSIGYVEAHGTGTRLGDPIEVQALTKAFRATTDKKAFCGLGSIKTNIGHLDTAAGVAGLIKAVLSLKHKQLPPSLHFEKPNPQIDFVNSPFYVNSTLKDWDANGLPRRAGVSSFGLGGTNIHVVLEEPPELLADPGPGRPLSLLVLSARSERALTAAGVNLKEHLQQHSDLNMSDVAYTCQIGRKTFHERQAIVCSDLQDCVQALGDRRRILRGTPADDGTPFLVFMFPGQGSQHVNMAAELYRTEPRFKEVVDQCCEYLEPELGFDLRSLLFADETRVAEITARLNQTRATQPALFVIEYALARLWMEWGVRPEAMIGHSIGEYVAACLAGVFSLEDALTLVAARGKLINELPGGAMLAIPFSEARAREFLDDELSLAASNSPALSVVSGPVDAIDRLEKQLTEQDLICHRLRTSHAFHSAMVEPVLETFAELVARANPQPPQMRLISNLSGAWMESIDATDPQYWSKHLRYTVRFARGLQTLSENRRLVLLEVGPGQHLSGLAAGQLDGEKCSVVSSLPHPRKPRSEVASMLEALGKIWIAGVDVDWRGFNSRQRHRRVPLPTYPFERRRYWVEAQPSATQEITEEPETRPVATSYPRPVLREPYVAPTTELQTKIAEVWQRVLAIEEIGINDDFFELGGNSLVATQLVMEMREAFTTSVPLRDFFETPTIAAVSALLEAEAVKQRPKIKPIPRNSMRRKVSTAGSRV